MANLVKQLQNTISLTTKTKAMKPANTHQKNTARHIMDNPDPTGTDPNRYASVTKEAKPIIDADDYSKTPDNHPAPEDIMLNPKKGE